MIRLTIRTLIVALFAALLAPLTVQAIQASASAVPCTTPACFPGPRYQVIEVRSYPQSVLYGLGEIASCENPRGTCTITRVESRSTTVQTDLGLSAGAVATSLGYSLNQTSSTSVGCTSPRLRRGEIYRAYVRGSFKTYQIKKTYAGHTWISNRLIARQPYKNSISCRVEQR